MAVASAATLPLIVQGGWQLVWILLSWGVFLAALYTTQDSESPNFTTPT
jgi:hypothetical protein